jgi:hypothetical protein
MFPKVRKAKLDLMELAPALAAGEHSASSTPVTARRSISRCMLSMARSLYWSAK